MDPDKVGCTVSAVVDVNADNWEQEVLQANTLVLVDFWHDQCIWCKRLEPIYHKVAKEYKDQLKFVKLNILESHENQHLGMKYGVMGTPTLIFFCGSRSVGTSVGFQPETSLKQAIDDMLDKHTECIKQSTAMT